MQTDLFVLDGAPDTFDEHVVAPAAFAVNADRDAVLMRYADEGGTRDRCLMTLTRPRVSVTALVEDLLADHLIDAFARVIRMNSAIYILVTLQRPPLNPDIFDGPASISEIILGQLRERLDPQFKVDGIFWNAANRAIKYDELQTQKAALSEKIKALRLRRTDIGLESDC